ncbi:ABC transporter substrate-binding protein [Kribbella italica]|uniref:ABC-type glycerol-3-phosphate transport system substrate-binding protein n=1 Tax=Kribbella italica TaxID=1540520 RepID=A0A7W9J498_9ACTN|nr:extracellular solute-binding protein [Kribbella italica]MBB5835268.1 ABC-type glycerol-3-phosphate transport system substrate-binding protein [Kribbella italica]
MTRTARCAAALTSAALLLTAAACADGTTPAADSGGAVDQSAPVTITIGDRPTPDKPNDIAAFDRNVKKFMTENPNITVKSTETKWDAQTFQAQVAGGSLPTVMNISFTEPANMIPNKQLPDITDELKLVDLTKDLNPQTLKIVQDDAGRIYGVPIDVFSVGLAYNRALFTQAGLDPDKPPANWDEVRQYAKQITEKTGKAGYAQLTKDNTGGWMLTTMTYSLGGTVQSQDGKKSTFNDAPTKKALQLLKDMRWTDNAMGSNFLYNQEEIRQDFAAGKIGMVLQAPDAYDMAVKNFGMKPADYGHGALPQDGGPHGTLTGGSLKMINPKASKNEIVAALKWIKSQDFDKYTNEQLAVQNAKETIADKGFVGRPGITPLSQATYDQYNKWREPYSNVPVKQFQGYIDSTTSLKLLPEPSNKGQEVYALLDPVVQQVLTKKDADIDKLLTDAASKIDARLAR